MPEILHGLESKFGSEYGSEEEAAMLRVLHQNAPTSGDACIQFERDFAAYTGVDHARAVSNGTAALFLSLLAAGVKAGDEVITTPLTWIATAAAAETLGARAIFADVDPRTYNLDPDRVAEKITSKTRAIVPVHLYGQCCDMDEFLALADAHGLAVIEDACHAVGASYKGRKAGSMGTLGCFSFHEQKNMSTLGEGGIIVTNAPALFERVALYRSHCTRVYGHSTKYCSIDESQRPMGRQFWYQDFDDCGYNFRMTDMQAAVGVEQLKKLDALNARRQEAARYLTERLQDIPGLTLPCTAPDRDHVYHLYPMQVHAEQFGLDKEAFIYRMLHEHGVKVGTHYIPLHYSTAFRNRGYEPGQLPVTEDIATRLVTLPLHPRLTQEALDHLVTAIRTLSRAS